MSTAPKPPPIPWITRVRLSNYKSIAECDVTLEPLTVLVGPNGVGKTNFLDALRFIGEATGATLSGALQARGGVDGILTRVPEATSSFTVRLDVKIPLSAAMSAEGYYAFEMGHGGSAGRGPSRPTWEECHLRWRGGGAKFRVDSDGMVSDSSYPSSTPLRANPDRLYLLTAGGRDPWSAVADRLAAMRFYHFDPHELRQFEPERADSTLEHDGGQLANVLGALADNYPEVKERIDSYLSVVAPYLEGVDRLVAAGYVAVEARNRTGVSGAPVRFGPEAISDGTIRAAAVLAALFQPGVLAGAIPLVGIEEPETALHPAAAGVLFDALTEASERVQVIVTTQSDDLLDRKVDPYDFDPSMIRAVGSRDGLTVIGEINEASMQAIRERRFTAGELMRAGQLYPESAVDSGTAGGPAD